MEVELSPAPARTQSDRRDLDVPTRLRAAVGRLSRRLRVTPAARAAGLTPTQSSILLALARSGPARLSELAESEGLNPTMLSRVVAGLGEAGLLERTSDSSDRRAAWVGVTARGRRLADRVRAERTDAVNAALQGLSDRERRQIEASLPALEALAEQLKDGDR